MTIYQQHVLGELIAAARYARDHLHRTLDRPNLASLAVAQAIDESDWLHHAPGLNCFGRKAPEGWTGPVELLRTHEHINGRWIEVHARFMRYGSLAEAFADHAHLLACGRPYREAQAILADGPQDELVHWRQEEHEIPRWRAHILAVAEVYATNPSYGHDLLRYIDSLGLRRIDEPASA